MADSSQLAMQSELESAVKDAWKCLQFKKCQKKCWKKLGNAVCEYLHNGGITVKCKD